MQGYRMYSWNWPIDSGLNVWKEHKHQTTLFVWACDLGGISLYIFFVYTYSCKYASLVESLLLHCTSNWAELHSKRISYHVKGNITTIYKWSWNVFLIFHREQFLLLHITTFIENTTTKTFRIQRCIFIACVHFCSESVM